MPIDAPSLADDAAGATYGAPSARAYTMPRSVIVLATAASAMLGLLASYEEHRAWPLIWAGSVVVSLGLYGLAQHRMWRSASRPSAALMVLGLVASAIFGGGSAASQLYSGVNVQAMFFGLQLSWAAFLSSFAANRTLVGADGTAVSAQTRWDVVTVTFLPITLTLWAAALAVNIPAVLCSTILMGVFAEWQRSMNAKARALADARASLAEANEKLAALAMSDGLTGVGNRRAFDLWLRRAASHARASGEPLALLLTDIDFFKKLNDSLGHAKGDDCLRQVAGALSGVTRRTTDRVARYGGEEFALILPSTDEAGALRLAEAARRAVMGLGFENPGSPLGQVTISLGCATLEPGQTDEDLTRQADRALYAAKSGGRNRVASARLPLAA